MFLMRYKDTIVYYIFYYTIYLTLFNYLLYIAAFL